ncbi:MAG: hypothetical protein ACOC1X_03300, partial [Promethearchaeota archaeon]
LLQKSYKNHGENHYERFKKAEKFYKNRLGVDSKKVKKVSIIHSTPPTSKDQIKVFESASDSIFKHMKDVLYEIYQKIKNKDPSSDIISQNYPFLRFFQAIISFFEVKTK